MSSESAARRLTHFTVVIPCKDRAPYLVHTLRTCMLQDYDALEIVVSDDGSTDVTRDVIEDAARKDPRIRPIFHDRPVGMRDNFEIALRAAKPGFVIALGGDDGLMPNGIAGMSEVLRETKTELLSWPAPIYSYPGARGPHGQLSIVRASGTRCVKSKDFLCRQARNLHYLSDIESPMFYVKGVAATRLIDQVRARSADGRFYACATPDGYSGIVLAGEVERFSFSGRPYSLHGLSVASQGLAYLSNDPEAKKTSESFYRKAAEVPMHRELGALPYSPLIALMTADYLLRARDLEGWPGRFPEIDYRQLLVKSLKELSHGLYGADRICRELAILDRIAGQHGLRDFFRDEVRRRRRRPAKDQFTGSGISPAAVYFDAAAFRITNVLEAAHAASAFYELSTQTRPGAIIGALLNSLKYRFASLGRGDSFPDETAWASADLLQP